MEYHAFQASCRWTVTALHLYICHLSERDPSFAVFPENSNGNIHIFQEKKRPCTYFPPKSCIPRRAKMKMNRRRRKIKLRIDLMLFKREVTKLRKDAQNLEKEKNCTVLSISLFSDSHSWDSSFPPPTTMKHLSTTPLYLSSSQIPVSNIFIIFARRKQNNPGFRWNN